MFMLYYPSGRSPREFLYKKPFGSQGPFDSVGLFEYDNESLGPGKYW